MRLICLLGLCALVFTPTQGAHGQDDQWHDIKGKKKIFSAYFKGASADASAINFARDPSEIEAASARLVQKTDHTFNLLQQNQLLDMKLLAYKHSWLDLKPGLAGNPTDPITRAKFQTFYKNLASATEGTNCTFVVNASQGVGALVMYAKAQDADTGGRYRELGMVVQTVEVEPAEYKFKSFRKGKETGNTNAIPCLDVKRPVPVTVVEK